MSSTNGLSGEGAIVPRFIDHKIFLKSVILLGVIVSLFAILAAENLLAHIIESDRSMLSIVILLIYTIASLHWLYLSWDLSLQRVALDRRDKLSSKTLVSTFVIKLESVRSSEFKVLSDRLQNRHAPGHFIADSLLKLGLLGTIIGFILMLLPVGEIEDFDTNLIQQLMVQMSGGMAVALYTTLAGLVTSTLLKLQYLLADSALSELLTDLNELMSDEEH